MSFVFGVSFLIFEAGCEGEGLFYGAKMLLGVSWFKCPGLCVWVCVCARARLPPAAYQQEELVAFFLCDTFSCCILAKWVRATFTPAPLDRGVLLLLSYPCCCTPTHVDSSRASRAMLGTGSTTRRPTSARAHSHRLSPPKTKISRK